MKTMEINNNNKEKRKKKYNLCNSNEVSGNNKWCLKKIVRIGDLRVKSETVQLGLQRESRKTVKIF